MSNTSSEAADITAKPKKLLPISLVLSLPAIVLLKAGIFLLVVGMFPTLLIFAIGRAPQKYVISTVAAFNFAGVFPELLSIFLQHGTPRAMLDTLSEPAVWENMFGPAALGWAIVWLSPAVAMLVLESVYRGRLQHMERQQKQLEEEWGPDIKGSENARTP